MECRKPLLAGSQLLYCLCSRYSKELQMKGVASGKDVFGVLLIGYGKKKRKSLYGCPPLLFDTLLALAKQTFNIEL